MGRADDAHGRECPAASRARRGGVDPGTRDGKLRGRPRSGKRGCLSGILSDARAARVTWRAARGAQTDGGRAPARTRDGWGVRGRG